MDIKEEIESILTQIGLKDPEFEIEMTSTGRIGGFVISESFMGKSHIDRQNMLWDKLDRILDEDKRAKIIGLLTMTPVEAEEADAA
ncbi:Uncharacterized protein dnl_62810 [Desulfonema limicola]|uniref:Uncharacterized protein n=1 Tax=Desulfonema limicola TaxID=45656 RepID=A0A975BEX9_9BACT|nr:hypothetical protein [Desulfonema limicola]QTA83860.1 Uncharacterized protein dnl_62810 [Desulfonema limicola]